MQDNLMELAATAVRSVEHLINTSQGDTSPEILQAIITLAAFAHRLCIEIAQLRTDQHELQREVDRLQDELAEALKRT